MKIFFIIIFVFILQGCETVYERNGFSGGYSEVQLDENVFKVTFKGNGFTSREKVFDFALLRSAEVSLYNGYKYFTIIDADNYVSSSTYTTPSTSTTTANLYNSGGYVYGNATTTTHGGQSYNISKPSSSNIIVCFKEKPDNLFSYNAHFLYKSLVKEYGIVQKPDISEIKNSASQLQVDAILQSK